MDKLIINDLKLVTLIGTHDWEQQTPQTLHCDIMLQTDAKSIAKTDNIETAINYDKVTEHLLNFVKQHHFQLIETLAEHLATTILKHFPTSWVQVILHKPGALKQANVAIMIERTK
ncbi:MAG: dihydroneopterin aldolase [Candidatus Berkiellales bacterium]